MLLGNLLSDQRQWTRAAAAYTEVIRRSPAYVQAYNNLGLLFLREGDFRSAQQRLREAIDKDPKYAEAHYNLGLALAKLGEQAHADQQFSIARSLDPSLFMNEAETR